MKGNLIKIFIILLFALLFLNTSTSFALEINYPHLPGRDVPPPQEFLKTAEQEEILGYFAKYILHLAIWLAGLIAFGGLIVGGIRYLLSGGEVEKTKASRAQIISSLLGILILFSSFVALKVINPQILLMGTEVKTEPAQKSPQISISSPPPARFQSGISSEYPFGIIIEDKILENKVPPSENRKSRMERIGNVGENTLSLAEKLKEQSQQLKKASEKCSCDQSRPCCEDYDPGPGCIDNACRSKPGCTCDPCKKVRGEIKDLQQKNLENIYQGTSVTQTDSSGNQENITTSLIEEQEKATKEIRLLREELGKLEQAEKYILSCNSGRESLSEFLAERSVFEASKWKYESVKFWEKIPLLNDSWATFYCLVSGNIWETGPAFPGLEEEISTEDLLKDLDMDLEEAVTPCLTEIPVGEIISRTKRTGYKLVERMEKLIKLNEELIKAVEDLHILISQCSSQGPSPSIPGRGGCFSICSETETTCIKRCQGQPCPDGAIEEKLKQIINIIEGVPNEPAGEEKKDKEGIRDVVEAQKKTTPEAIKDSARREQIGLFPIINQVVPEILEDLATKVRTPMKKCVTEEHEFLKDTDQPYRATLSCEQSLKNAGPHERIIENCCYGEDWYKDCLGECYLEGGTSGSQTPREYKDNYKKCLNSCLERKAEQTGIEEIADCFHGLNFFCCSL